MSYRCEDLENALLDLIYNELPRDKMEEARRHIAECAACSEVVERCQLTRAMASLSVAPSLSEDFGAAILSAARAQCDAVIDSVPAVVRDKTPNGGFFRMFSVAWALLRRPAFATALVAGAVLLVTVFFVEHIGPSKGTEGNLTTLLEKAPLGPVVEPPAAKMDLENDSKHSRMAGPVEAISENQVTGEDKQPIEDRGAPAPIEDRGAPAASVAPTPEPSVLSSEPLSDDLRAKGRADARSRKKDDVSEDALATPYDDELKSAPTKRMSAPKAFAGKSKTSENSEKNVFKEGMSAYKRGDCKAAISAFEKVVQSPGLYPGKRAPAMHHLARCEKRQGHCSNAMAWYDNLISDHPAYVGMPSALWEASHCSRRLGRNGRARELLEMLSTIPGWEERAQRQLDKM